MKALVYFFPVLILINTLHSQAHTWYIFTLSDQPYSNVVLDTLKNDTLQVKVFGKFYKIPVDSIATFRRERESYTGAGVTLGVLSGLIIGGVAGSNAGHDKSPFEGIGNALGSIAGSILGALVGGIIGGSVGSGLGNDEIYNFRQKKKDEKNTILKGLIRKSKKEIRYSKFK